MLNSRIAESRSPAKSVRRREMDEDEARWEARLRQLAARKAPGHDPAGPVPRPLRKTSLQLASNVTCRDALLLPRSLPSFSGDEPEDFVCGKCFDLIGSRISPRTIRSRNPEGERLVIRCLCGALNLLSRNGFAARRRPAPIRNTVRAVG